MLFHCNSSFSIFIYEASVSFRFDSDFFLLFPEDIAIFRVSFH